MLLGPTAACRSKLAPGNSGLPPNAVLVIKATDTYWLPPSRAFFHLWLLAQSTATLHDVHRCLEHIWMCGCGHTYALERQRDPKPGRWMKSAQVSMVDNINVCLVVNH